MIHIKDDFKKHQERAFALYEQGKSISHIADVTGVPKIRIQHAIEQAVEERPGMLSKHLAAQYPCHHKQPARWPRAQIIIERRELVSQ